MSFINGIIELGPTVMMPIIFFILSLIFRVKIAQGFKAAMLVGIGFVGINLVIGLLLDTLGPAAEAMVQRFNLNLTVVDPGWPVGATIGWGTPIVPFVVFGAIILNVVLLLLKLTKTVNIDIFNYWHFMLTGGVVYAVTNSIVISVVSALLHFLIAIIIADLTAKRIQEQYDLKGVSFAHATSAIYVPIGIVMNWIIERIPGLNKVKASPEEITKRYGVMGEPLTLGTILGILLGLLAGLPLADVVTLGIKVAAVMVLLPAMINILVQGLEIVREAAEVLLKKKFPDREFYIGLDTALLVGNPAVLATGLLLIPGALLLAIILPGNKVLPFVDLASLVFLLPMAAPFLKRNLVRLFLTGMVIVTFVLYAGTSISSYYTKAAEMVNVTLPENVQSATGLSNLVGGATTPLGWLIIEISKLF
ncbi:PTS transporter subunit IIC [Priestia endophytica]|uniref:PTS system, galactitol-specific IIC component n=1 Tax=Priestia endophytica DSM 13796 TaxID=1121089 RepID=A0A1I6BBR4_9BACI|nr:PTS transporter subunit IIC [Priestia endophytica]KYG26162.1 PTS galactitol transporter subunit IIC [Priestia endophytica]MBG9813786.1 PTS system galactitol-specific transporter subunit IIC [Priestia endophytica]MCM3537839.1 PTS galactitol transporter subunit IIC [Priestia endophytica]RAS83715.1 PTS galactitol transporter subunit IIC [Priestia endophytica]RPK08220.1 PTS system, galactitol-specific IIC component [Priestia endophytica]